MAGSFSIGLKAIVYNEKNEILLLQRSSSNTRSGLYDVPGGRMENDEDIQTALSREIKEETGLILENVGIILDISTFRPTAGESQIVRILFSCKVHGDVLLSDEHSNYVWVSLENISNYPLYSKNIGMALEKYKTVYQQTPQFLSLSFISQAI